MKVQEYFSDKELRCGCGCGLMSPKRAVEMLYAVRIIFGKPIIITSAIRCRKHNTNVGGSKNSVHLPWQERAQPAVSSGAFDIVAVNKERHRLYEYDLIKICQAVGFTGIGIKDNTFLHIDNRIDAPAVWGYPR
jgi:hypothetical protein